MELLLVLCNGQALNRSFVYCLHLSMPAVSTPSPDYGLPVLLKALEERKWLSQICLESCVRTWPPDCKPCGFASQLFLPALLLPSQLCAWNLTVHCQCHTGISWWETKSFVNLFLPCRCFFSSGYKKMRWWYGTELLPWLCTCSVSTIFVISWPSQYPSLGVEMRQDSIIRNTKGIFLSIPLEAESNL